MSIAASLLEVRDHAEAGYRPVLDFDAWRVAILNHAEDLRPENLTRMQRHNETDEVFVLLRGRCILFLGQGADAVTRVFAEDMQPFKIYNVKKAAWHTHTLSEDAMVLIVENRDTTYDNSPFCSLTESQRQTILNLTSALWGNRASAS
ncbi:MAG: hypothetical protein AUK28_11400 [Desulfobacterales bacterium CG2_30_60_27]|nr:MAG: hypothetical protein AUK28_11400 [Desulfobacterales bacterium CG2_30_60_27]